MGPEPGLILSILSENVPPLLKDTKNDEASVSRRGLPQCRKRSSTDDRGKMSSELLVLGNGILVVWLNSLSKCVVAWGCPITTTYMHPIYMMYIICIYRLYIYMTLYVYICK